VAVSDTSERDQRLTNPVVGDLQPTSLSGSPMDSRRRPNKVPSSAVDSTLNLRAPVVFMTCRAARRRRR